MTLTCAICTEAFLPTAKVNTTPCGHMYHHNCMSRWLEQSQTCPQCRKRCTAAQLIKMHLNGTAGSDTTRGNSYRNGLLVQKLDSLTLKIRDQEQMLKTLKEDAISHNIEQKKMSKTLNDLEDALRSKNEKAVASNRDKRESVPRVPMHRMSQLSSQNLVWIDLEMTGLDVDKDRILEIACIVTDSKLNIIAKGPNVIINEPNPVLDTMHSWCKEHHSKSGLIEAVKNSTYTLAQAEQQVLDFVKQYCPARSCPMAGNSIYMDRLFVMKHMPTLNEYLHYRVIDVSTVKELSKRWNGDVYKSSPPKILAHRALDDIEESIKEMTYYKNMFFKTDSNAN